MMWDTRHRREMRELEARVDALEQIVFSTTEKVVQACLAMDHLSKSIELHLKIRDAMLEHYDDMQTLH